MRTRALRPVRQERNRRILGPKLTVTDRYSPLVDTRDRFGKRVGVNFQKSQLRKALVHKAFRSFSCSLRLDFAEYLRYFVVRFAEQI